MKKNLMRLLCGFCLLVVIALCPIGKTNVQAASQADAKSKYEEFMKTKPSYVAYKLIDITKDGIPELITKTDMTKAGKLKSHRFVVYTYSDGKVKHCATYYEKYKNIFYYPGTNVLVAQAFGKRPVFEYFKLGTNGDKLFAYSYFMKGKRHYAYKDLYCLRAKFNKRIKKIVRKSKLTLIKF